MKLGLLRLAASKDLTTLDGIVTCVVNEPDVPTVKVFNNTGVDSSQIVACVPGCKPLAAIMIVVPAAELSLDCSSEDEFVAGTILVVGFVDELGKVEVVDVDDVE